MTSKAVAFHEAGHAVAAWYAGEPVYAIQVSPKDDPVFTDRDGRARAVRGLVESSGILGFTCVPFETLLETLPAETLPAEHASTLLHTVAVAMMILEAGPIAEARVSRRSLAEVALSSGAADYEQIKCARGWLPDSARSAARAASTAGARVLVRRGWPAIERLASALMERGGLDGEEAIEIVEAAWTMGVLPDVPRRAHASPLPPR